MISFTEANRSRRTMLAAAAIMLSSTGLARAQPPVPPVAASDAVEDRVVALVQAGKCDAAKDAAEKGGQARLAEQVGEMCGAKAATGGGGRQGSSSHASGRKGSSAGGG